MKAFAGKTQYYQDGMELRDYFAAKAMQAMIPATIKAIADELATSKQVVDASYQWADLMMKARYGNTGE